MEEKVNIIRGISIAVEKIIEYQSKFHETRLLSTAEILNEILSEAEKILPIIEVTGGTVKKQVIRIEREETILAIPWSEDREKLAKIISFFYGFKADSEEASFVYNLINDGLIVDNLVPVMVAVAGARKFGILVIDVNGNRRILVGDEETIKRVNKLITETMKSLRKSEAEDKKNSIVHQFKTMIGLH